MPDAFPVADGHTLIIPRKHVMTIYHLKPSEQSAIWKLVSEVRERLLTGLKPDGFNIGFNDGLAAGQTVQHAHVHIIPLGQQHTAALGRGFLLIMRRAFLLSAASASFTIFHLLSLRGVKEVRQ